MAYRYDPDLEFLSKVSSEDLDILVTYLTEDKDGEKRYTEELTNSKQYKTYYPNHQKYWDLIAAELQCFGANSLVTIFRGGKGVLYREVLTDVCDKVDVKYGKNDTIEKIESALLLEILKDSLEKMSPEERKQVVKELNLRTTNFTPQGISVALQAAIKLSGFTAYKVALIVANAIAKTVLGRGLSLAANAGLTRVIGMFAGPIGWIITGIWTAVDIAGPAYRVTIPAVIQVAFLRAQYMYGDTEEVGEASLSFSSCPECGHRIPQGTSAKFCMECGAKLQQSFRCPTCSARIQPGAKFCSECGTRLQ